MGSTRKINPPTLDPAHPDYQAHCQFALEPSVRKLMEMAGAAGWDPRQVAYAVMVLAATSHRSEELS